MNGIALLLLTATLGVEYDWRTTEDGQIEYILIVEPDFLPNVAEGSPISSSVPPELEAVNRLCIRIAQPANGNVAPRPETPRSLPATAFRSQRIGLRASTEPTTIVWKAKGQPEESTAVKYGWQPTKEGLQEYFVQIDPKYLRTLAPGDEIYTQLSAEAGRVDTFVVFSNAKPLPKVAGRPAANLAGSQPGPALPGAPLPGATLPGAPFSSATYPAATQPATTFNQPPASPFGAPNALGGPQLPSAPHAASTNNSPFGPLPGAPPVERNPPLGHSAGTYAGVNDNNNVRVTQASGYDSSGTTAGYGNQFQQPGATRPGLNPPLAPGNATNHGGYLANDRQNEPFRNNDLRSNDPRMQPSVNDPFRTAPAVDPRNDLFPGNGQFANGSTSPQMRNANLPVGAAGVNGPNNAPYRPNVGYAQDQGTQPASYDNRVNPNAPTGDYRTNPNDLQMASLGTNTLRPGLQSNLPLTGAPPVPAEKPWWTLVFMAFGLFISIGANFYLAWTAGEFYSRYKLAVERLRTSSRG